MHFIPEWVEDVPFLKETYEADNERADELAAYDRQHYMADTDSDNTCGADIADTAFAGNCKDVAAGVVTVAQHPDTGTEPEDTRSDLAPEEAVPPSEGVDVLTPDECSVPEAFVREPDA